MQTFEKAVSAGVTPTETGGFRGYAARFLNIDRQGDMILPGAFSKALPDFLDSGGLVLADHTNQAGAVIGTLIDAREDRSGLVVDVQFSATKSGQDVRQLMAEKALRKMSIQFYGKSKPYTEAQIKEVWATYGFNPSERQKALAKRGCKVITEVAEILEVSVVPIPANPDANILAVKSFDEENTSAKSVVPQIDIKALLERAAIAERILGR
jgi:HK97 family phage prohead protease